MIPTFLVKVRDIAGLYLSPPTNALVLCVDEKSQCQALEGTQPMLPMGGTGAINIAIARSRSYEARG